MERGKVLFVPTPIGNLQDITLRALDVLGDVDLIACEDTRHTLKLLNHYGIKKKLIACEKFNEAAASQKIIVNVDQGRSVAVVSDAGMPAISDPGTLLIAHLREAGVAVEVLPGACAFVTALAASGYDGPSRFIGFFPRKRSERMAEIFKMRVASETTIFYESPRRIASVLDLLQAELPGCEICLAREISKLHEEYLFGPPATVKARIDDLKSAGELVCLVRGINEDLELTDEILQQRITDLLESGCSRKDTLQVLIQETGRSRNEIYKMILDRC